ncbi:hypothetical protein BVC80_9073g60 [Macleaya cordata]|uniref:Protein XRI1 n=1 Tax=Macleaya cordata TaxID=56857 RepID=A0A200PTW6_MACCD|nr:hypothetical protein BVC80_9073g60 [Macleaya cordata]
MGTSELCEWEGEDYYLQKDSHLGISNCLWDGVNQNEDDFSYMFEETTPIKACEDLSYSVSDRSTEKEVVEYRESYSQVKRRRMLQFDTHINDPFLCNEPTPLAVEKPKDREEAMEEVLPDKLKWVSGLSDRSVSCNESLDQSSDMWLSNCFNDGAMHFNSDDINFSGGADDQLDISEFCNIPPEKQADAVQQCATPPPHIVFKGRKSYMRTPTKVASSVAYPFALIKPCGVHGDVTLKDINQRIRTPPPSISKHDKDEEASPSYPTSAFSGKPVVVKTKIRTEGGKGSITIMRTKG